MDPYLSIFLIFIGIAIVVFRIMYELKKIDKSVIFFLITISVIIFTAFYVDDIEEYYSDKPDSYVFIIRQDWYDKLEYEVPSDCPSCSDIFCYDLDIENEDIYLGMVTIWEQNQTISEGQTIYSILFVNLGEEIEDFLWIQIKFTDDIGKIKILYPDTIKILTETNRSTMIKIRVNELLPLYNESMAIGQTIIIGINGTESNITEQYAWTRIKGFNTEIYFCDRIFTF